jgi:hypothetical protein
MGLRPGVFVSKTSTNDWEPDPEVPGSQMHELVHRDGVWAGLTRFTNWSVQCLGRPNNERSR